MAHIKPNTKQHSKLVNLSVAAFDYSKRYMENRYTQWKANDRVFRCYIDPTARDPETNKKENPFQRHVYIPYAKLNADIMLTYLLSVFTMRRPSFPLEGRSPNDVMRAKIWSQVLDYQMYTMDYILLLYTYFLDSLKYGFGVMKTGWNVDNKWREIGKTDLGNGYEDVLYEEYGHRETPHTINIDPYRVFFDPRVPLCDFQQGEYVGHVVDRSYNYLMGRKNIYFNLNKLKTVSSNRDSNSFVPNTDRVRRESVDLDADMESAPNELGDTYEIKELWIKLIPKEYGLSPSTSPELWVISMVDDSLIIRAEPSPYGHGKFPFNITEYDYDGYSLLNPALLEIIEPMQRLMNWLYNSHIENVMRGINIRALYDPSAIWEEDLMNNRPMQFIRMKEGAEGRDIRSFFHQLPIADVTSQHLSEMTVIGDLIQRVTGASESLQGKETQVKRTAFEINQMTRGSLNRFAFLAKRMSTQGIKPWIEMCMDNNQEFLTHSAFYKIVGDDLDEIQNHPEWGQFVQNEMIEVNPDDLRDTNVNYVINDGTLPMNPADNAETWIEIMKVVAQFNLPLDIYKIFTQAVEGLNIRNIEDFKPDMPMMQNMPIAAPNDQIINAAQAGNLIPLETYRPGQGVIA